MALSGLITESIKLIVRIYCHSSLSHYKLKVLSRPLSLNGTISSIIINQSDLCIDQGKTYLCIRIKACYMCSIIVS